MSDAPILPALEALPKARRLQSGGWVACCPAHDDRTPSLAWTVAAEDGRVLLTCHAGCTAEAVAVALGRTLADLFEPSPGVRIVADKPAPGPRTRARRFACTDADGRRWTHVRHEDADGRKVGPMPWEPAGAKVARMHPYGSGDLATAPDPVVMVEGEATAEAVRAAGFAAVGTFGIDYHPDPDALAPLTGRTVVLWPDADADPAKGRAHMLDMAARLRSIAGSLRWVEPPAGLFSGWDAADAGEDRVRELVANAGDVPHLADPPAFAEPEDRGAAVLSELGTTEYVEDLIRPGRIVVWAAEEGAGKSYTVDGELGIRVAVAGGALAGTWPILERGPVLVLSEMHADDDYAREASILEALELERQALTGRYYRLPLMTAAGGPPVLTVAAWREWVTGWLRDRGALLLIVDTATGATQVDPWGSAIQAVYRDLRAMLEAYPRLAVVLVLHLKKPQGRGDRRISDVLGEWGRWCDVIMLQEADGTARTKLATYKRIRRQRRIVATRADGLLVDPVDLDAATGAKVKPDAVLAAIEAAPGLTFAELGAALGVSHKTAKRYVAQLGEAVDAIPGTARSGPGAAARLYPVGTSGQIGTGTGVPMAVPITEAMAVGVWTSGHPPYRGVQSCPDPMDAGAVSDDDEGPEGTDVLEPLAPVIAPEPPGLFALASEPPCFADADDYRAHASDHYRDGAGWGCRLCETAGVSA